MRNSVVTFLVIINASYTLIGQGLFESALTNSDSSFLNSDTYMHGFVRSAVYAGRKANESPYLQSLYGEFALKADVPAGSFGSAYAEVRFRTGNEFGNDFKEVLIREAFVNLYFGPLHVRAGKQILTTGVAGFINPTDLYAPTDPVYRSPCSDDLRLGNWALTTSLMITMNSSIEFIWLPIYRPSELITDALEFPVDVQFLKYSGSELKLKNSGLLGKYALHSPHFDMELSFFHGYRNIPGIMADTVILNPGALTPETVKLMPEPYLVSSPGLNLSVPLGDLIIRGEGAWIAVDDAADGLFSEISYAAEIEQSGSSVSLIGGYYGKYIINYEAPMGDPLLITGEFPDFTGIVSGGNSHDMQFIGEYFETQVKYFNRIYNYQVENFYHSVYASLHLKMFNDLLEMNIPAMYNFTSQEFMVMPSIEFFINDQLNIYTGGYFLKGNKPSLYQLAGPALNAVYVMFQVKF